MVFSNIRSRVSQKLVQTQQHVDRRAAKRTAASLFVHFVGTRLRSVDDRTAPARCVYHAVPRDTPRKSQQLRQLIRSLAYRRRHWCRHHSDAVCCHPGPRCRRRRPRMNGSHLASSLSRRHG